MSDNIPESSSPAEHSKALVTVPSTPDTKAAPEHLAIQVLDRIASHKDSRALTVATVRVLVAQDPELLAVFADAERRKTGMWLGAGLTATSLLGGIGLAAAGIAMAPVLLLLAIGAASAGATFAVITGGPVSMSDFEKVLTAARGKTSREDKL